MCCSQVANFNKKSVDDVTSMSTTTKNVQNYTQKETKMKEGTPVNLFYIYNVML